MLDEFDQFYDLTQLSARLEPFQRFRKLIGTIKHLQDAHSAQKDLELSGVILATAFNFMQNSASALPRRQDRDEGLIVGSLFTNALLHYVRATKSKSDTRKTFKVTNGWTENDLEKHAELTQLRDSAVAHFGPGRKSFWAEERLILCESADLKMVKFVNSRSNYRQYYFDILKDCLDVALQSIDMIVDRKGIDLFEEIIKHSLDHTLLYSLPQCNFDPNSFFLTLEANKQFREKRANFTETTTTLEAAQRPSSA